MKTCKQCGQTVQDNDTYCPRCGSGQLASDTPEVSKKQVRAAVPKTHVAEQKFEQPVSQVKQAPARKAQAAEPSRVDNGFDMGNTGGAAYTNQVQYQSDEVVSLKEYLIFYLIMMVPFYGIYKMIKTAIGGPNIKKSLTNLIRASLILSLVGVVISIIFSAAIGAMMVGILSNAR